ncbi:MAG: MFS transporter [Candidatus Thorarchaeota archaeon]
MNKTNVLVYLGTALLAFGESFSRGNFPSYVTVLGGSLVDYGFIQSARVVSNLIFLLPAAILADRFGHKRLLIAGTLVYIGSYAFIAFAPSWEYLLYGIAGVGLANGAVMPSRVAILAHNNEIDKINVFTRNETARWASLSLGYFVSAFFFALAQNEFSYYNLQFTMITTLLSVGFSLFPSLFLISDEDRQNSKPPHDLTEKTFSFGHMIKTPQGQFILGFLVINLIIGFGAGFLVPFTQPYFVQRFSLGPSEVNILNGIAQIITTIFMSGIPLLAARMSDIKVIYLTEGLSIPLTIVLALSNVFSVSLLAFFFRMALMNMSRPAQIAILQENVSETNRATAQSLMQAGDRIGRGGSPSISALLITETGDFTISFLITAGTYSAAVGTLFLITRNLRKKKLD